MPLQVIVSGGFDDLKSRDLRFLEEASKLGFLRRLQISSLGKTEWRDQSAVSILRIADSKFSEPERRFRHVPTTVYAT